LTVKLAIKLTYIAVCLFLLLGFPKDAIAQTGNPMLYKEIHLAQKSYTVLALTQEMQRQTGITFSYDAAKINAQKKIKIKQGNLTAISLLNLIKKRSGISYKLINNAHIIYKFGIGQKKTKPKKTKKKTPTAVTINNRPVLKEDIHLDDEKASVDDDEPQQVIVVGDSAVAAYYYAGGGGGGYGGGSGGYKEYTIQQAARFPTNSMSSWDNLDNNASGSFGSSWNSSNAISFFKNNGLVELGFSMDETYYFNPTARLGFHFLYGTVAYNLGAYPHVRYGIGTAARISERFRFHIDVTSGKPQTKGFTAINIDTIRTPQPGNDSAIDISFETRETPFVVSSKLSRVALSVAWEINDNFSISGGLIFNHLRTNYTSNNRSVNLSDILPIGVDADMKYRSIDPPYLLINSYSANKSANSKVWLGLQLTLMYRL